MLKLRMTTFPKDARSYRLVIPEAIEDDAAALERFIDQQCEQGRIIRLPGRIRTDCFTSADEKLVFAEFPGNPL